MRRSVFKLPKETPSSLIHGSWEIPPAPKPKKVLSRWTCCSSLTATATTSATRLKLPRSTTLKLWESPNCATGCARRRERNQRNEQRRHAAGGRHKGHHGSRRPLLRDP